MNNCNAGDRTANPASPVHPRQPAQGTHAAPFSQRPTVKLEKVCRLCRKDRQGAAVVEFAVVAPVLIMLIFGMVEFGRMVMVQQVLTNAAREGARVGVLDDSTVNDVQTTVTNYLTGGGRQGCNGDGQSESA